MVPSMKALLAHLKAALPKGTRQKDGIIAEDLRRMVHIIRDGGGTVADRLMWEAMYTLAWFGLLRPGEFTTPKAGAYDPSKHPSCGNIRFYAGAIELTLAEPEGGRMPTHMKFTVKESKTDQERFTKDILIGATGADVCGLTAMWRYMRVLRGAPQEALFRSGGG